MAFEPSNRMFWINFGTNVTDLWVIEVAHVIDCAVAIVIIFSFVMLVFVTPLLCHRYRMR